MAVDDRDPVTGRPIFLDAGAPDTAVDPTEVGKYAADVGNRIIRSTKAELDAYEYAREGLAGFAEDVEYLHDGSGWQPIVKLSNWETLTPSNSFTNVTGAPLQYKVTADQVLLRGGLYRSSTPSAFTVAATLPATVPAPANQVRTSGRDDLGHFIVITNAREIQMKATGNATGGVGYTFDGISYGY